jgi:hypothetical protein
VRRVCLRMFPSSCCPAGCSLHRPRTHPGFILDVVVPEAVLLLIQEDLGVDHGAAGIVIKASQEYGSAAHDYSDDMDDTLDLLFAPATQRASPGTQRPPPRPRPFRRAQNPTTAKTPPRIKVEDVQPCLELMGDRSDEPIVISDGEA